MVRLTRTCIPDIAIIVAKAAVQRASPALTHPLDFHSCFSWLERPCSGIPQVPCLCGRGLFDVTSLLMFSSMVFGQTFTAEKSNSDNCNTMRKFTNKACYMSGWKSFVHDLNNYICHCDYETYLTVFANFSSSSLYCYALRLQWLTDL